MKILLLNAVIISLFTNFNARATDIRMYIFGHSLIDHSTGSDETTVPYWLNEIVQSSTHSYAVGGQYGFYQPIKHLLHLIGVIVVSPLFGMIVLKLLLKLILTLFY